MGVRCGADGGEWPRVEVGDEDSETPGDVVDDAVEGTPSDESFKDDARLRVGAPSGQVHCEWQGNLSAARRVDNGCDVRLAGHGCSACSWVLSRRTGRRIRRATSSQ
jgi:hypothetical protein